MVVLLVLAFVMIIAPVQEPADPVPVLPGARDGGRIIWKGSGPFALTNSNASFGGESQSFSSQKQIFETIFWPFLELRFTTGRGVFDKGSFLCL